MPACAYRPVAIAGVPVLFAGVAVALLAGCSGTAAPPVTAASAPAPPPPVRGVALDFEERAASLGAVVPAALSTGTAPVTTDVATAAGGRIRRDVGSEGGYGIRFPAFVATSPTPAAVLLVRPQAGDDDPLSPGVGDLTFGLDFVLDQVSDGSPTDDGDNLLQRGLFNDDVQYKLQIDRGVPSCRVAGAEGEVFVSADEPVERGVWYRLGCSRRGDEVSLGLSRRTADGWSDERTWRDAGPLGSVDFGRDGPPIVVGGKVGPDGAVITSSTDQFNGAVDNVHVTCGE